MVVGDWDDDNDLDGFLRAATADLASLPFGEDGGGKVELSGLWASRFVASFVSSPALPITRTLEVSVSLPN